MLCDFATTWYVKHYIGADYTSQTRFDFDWYNPNPYQRTTGTIKII